MKVDVAGDPASKEKHVEHGSNSAVAKSEAPAAEIKISKPEELKPANGSTTTTQGPKENTAVLDLDALYPVFWSLQECFANPPRLLEDNSSLETFKNRLEATLAKFQQARREAAGSTGASDDARPELKRKRGHEMGSTTSNFNPKYLTSPDLFELEVGEARG